VRLFVALNLPPSERQAAWEATSRMRESGLPVRWVKPEGLHVTFKFLGEVDAGRAAAIGEALSAAVSPARPFEVTLGGVGAFPDLKRPRVVWLGVERHPALELLANDVEQALKRFDFPSELRPFHPHVTLGRAERNARPGRFGELPALAAEVSYQAVVRVSQVDLMESTLGRGGATYRVVHAAALTRT
jgi:2'-5' RNA ligase